MNELKRLYMLQICDSLFPIGAFTLSNGLETGGCPHTAIREDCSMNLEAVDEMAERFPDVQIIFIESGGDNLSATFSRTWRMRPFTSLMWRRARRSRARVVRA